MRSSPRRRLNSRAGSRKGCGGILLVGHADATVHLDGLASDQVSHVGAAGLGRARTLRDVVPAIVDGALGVAHDGARELELTEHVGGAVAQALERADLHPELLAGLQVGERALERLLEAADHLGAESDRGAIEDRVQDLGSGVDLAEESGAVDADVGEAHDRGIATVHDLGPLDLDAVRIRVGHEEREPVALARAAARPRHDHELVGHVTVEHEELLAADAVAVAVARGARLDGIRREAALLLERQGQQPVAAAQLGEQLLLDGLGAAQQHGVPAQQHARDERLGREHSPALAEHDAELAVAHVRTANVLGERDSEPAELGHLLPQPAREAGLIPRVAERAHPLDGRLVVEEAPRHVAQDQLVFGQDQSHGSRSLLSPPAETRAGGL
jgi:hypothetical protein